ncbi:hypothetical protein [Bradyrhizobium japonicum]|uniref:hypothetical protein n=1 Tax=Bradyrhizobium japonicum TaxID=375 RepID=UPI000424623B|nr:hypothetical protein [Bradyrhizobium japonicum]
MHRFIAQANVDHFISLLNGDDLTSDKRTAITKLLLAELDKLANELDHLEFAERKAAEGRDRVTRARETCNGHPFGTTEREQAERLLVSCENLQTVLEDFCHRLRDKINSAAGTIYAGSRQNLIY